MNLLAHLLLAERSDTSFAGQILGDEIKGWLDERFAPPIREGIRLHRAIDRYSDDHTLHRELRRTFEPPLRRYAGILVDIGLDHALARQWPAFHADTLNAFSDTAQRRVIAEWPSQAPFSSARLAWLARVLAGYAHPEGIQRALNSVARRLRRRNEVHLCLPELLARNPIFDDAIAALIYDLDRHVRDVALP